MRHFLAGVHVLLAGHAGVGIGMQQNDVAEGDVTLAARGIFAGRRIKENASRLLYTGEKENLAQSELYTCSSRKQYDGDTASRALFEQQTPGLLCIFFLKIYTRCGFIYPGRTRATTNINPRVCW